MQERRLLHHRVPVGFVRPLADHEHPDGDRAPLRRLLHDPHRPHHALLHGHLLLDAARQATPHPHRGRAGMFVFMGRPRDLL